MTIGTEATKGVSMCDLKKLKCPSLSCFSVTPYRQQLDLIMREVRFLTERYKLKDMEDDEIHDWKFAAMVIDRFAMVFLTIFTVVASVVILSDHP